VVRRGAPVREKLDRVTATDRAIELARAAASAAADKIATDIVALDVSEHLVITDAFVVASAPNDRQVRAIVEEIEERLQALGAKPIRREGLREGRWVLIDFGEVVVHVQHDEDREYYALERLWRDCPPIDLPEDVVRSSSRRATPVGAASSGDTAADGAASPGAGIADAGR